MKLRTYKYRVYPTAAQEEKAARAFGCARWFWNNSLALSKKVYEETGKRPSRFNLQARLPGLKSEEATKWLSECHSQALQSVLLHQELAWQAFFGKRARPPQFKAKKNRQSLSFPQGVKVDFAKETVFIPKVGEVSAKLHRSFEGAVKTATFTKTPTGNYYISILIAEAGEESKIENPEWDSLLGIDLGVKEFAVLSDGTRIRNPKHLSKKLKKLRRQQRIASRRKRDSNRRRAQNRRVAAIHEQVSNTRSDFHHQLTRRLVENQAYGSFALEDLGTVSMLKEGKRPLARSIQDAAFRQFRTILVYKANRAGKAVIFASRFAPTSKKCECGHVNHDLTLGEREWTCHKCGQVHDRDLHASRQIKREAFESFSTAGAAGIHARGESALAGSLSREKLQERRKA